MTDGAILDTMGITVTYRRGVSAPVQIVAIFEAEYVPVEIGKSDVAAPEPMIFVRLSALASEPDQGDEATVDGVLYAVEEVRKDGQGGAILTLRRK